jgi:hypothetical protein
MRMETRSNSSSAVYTKKHVDQSEEKYCKTLSLNLAYPCNYSGVSVLGDMKTCYTTLASWFSHRNSSCITLSYSRAALYFDTIYKAAVHQPLLTRHKRKPKNIFQSYSCEIYLFGVGSAIKT